MEPKYKATWGAELLIHSSWAGERNWQAIDIPKDARDFVKLRNAVELDSRLYIVPDKGGVPEIGAVVGFGNTKEAAIKHCRENAAKLEGYYIEVYEDSLDEADGEIKELAEYGITL